MAKVKTNADYAYEIQKYLKRISIDFNFLSEIYLYKQEEKVFLFSYIENFFDFKAELKYPIPETLLDYLETPLYISFNEDFSVLKKAKKKEILSISEKGITMETFIYNFVHEEIIRRLPEVTSEEFEIEVTDSEEPVAYFQDSIKILELPKKYLFRYSDGNIKFSYIPNNQKKICNVCKISYNTEFAEFNLYFNSIK